MDIVNFPNGFRPEGDDFLKREENKVAEFERLREQLGRGIVRGLQLTRQSDGSVTISSGHGNDNAYHAIVLNQSQALDLRGVALPGANKYRWVAVVLDYQQLEQGQAQGAASGTWAERIDSCEIRFVSGAEADSEAAAQRPSNTSHGLRVGDILYDDNGTRSVDAAAAEYLSPGHLALGVNVDFQRKLGNRFARYNKTANQNLSQLVQDYPQLISQISEYWIEGTEYIAGQVKLHSGIQFICTTDHTATEENRPYGQVGGVYWAFEDYHNASWHTGYYYIVGQVKIHNSIQYICTQAHTSTDDNKPSTQTGNGFWEQVSGKVLPLGVDLSISAKLGNRFARYNKTANQNLSQLIQDYPQLISQISEYWIDGTEYIVGQVKLHNSIPYICIQAHTSTDDNKPNAQTGNGFWESLDYRAFDKLYPYGSLFFSSGSSKNPADPSLLGFGTWYHIPDGHAIAVPGDGLGLSGTVNDQLQQHGHIHGSSRWGDNNDLWHSDRTLFSAGSGQAEKRFNYGIFDVSGARAGSVTRGKRFGAHIWKRVG